MGKHELELSDEGKLLPFLLGAILYSGILLISG